MSNPCANEFTKKFNLVFIETIQRFEDIHLRRLPIETELNEIHFLLKFRHPVEKKTNETWSSKQVKKNTIQKKYKKILDINNGVW